MVAVYTGFAIVLTTLIWVYLSWLILLIGAQLAFYVQFPHCMRHGHDRVELSGGDREQIGLSIMYLIGRDYRRRQELLERRPACGGIRPAGHGAGARAGAPGARRLAGRDRKRAIGSRPRSARNPAGRHLGCGTQPGDGPAGDRGTPHRARRARGERSGGCHAPAAGRTIAQGPDRQTRSLSEPVPHAHSPAMVISCSRIEPTRVPPRASTSSPTAAMPLSMSRRLPAMVISATGY